MKLKKRKEQVSENEKATVLATGGAGFIGSHIVDLLIENNYKVVIVDDLSSGREENINKKARFYKLSRRNLIMCAMRPPRLAYLFP